MSSENGLLTTSGRLSTTQLRILVRKTHDKRSQPTAAILDSQSVKSDGHGGSVGYDAAKRIKGLAACINGRRCSSVCGTGILASIVDNQPKV